MYRLKRQHWSLMQVQQINQNDRSINLHTRSNKYRKLNIGQLVKVPPRLIKRQSSHFIDLDAMGIQMIVGCNGWIWLGLVDKKRPVRSQLAEFQLSSREEVEEQPFDPDRDQLLAASRLANAILGLAKLSLPIYKDALLASVELSIANNVAISKMLDLEFLANVVELEEGRRSKMDTSN